MHDAVPKQRPSISSLVPAVTAGLIGGILAITLQLSFAALIFSGELSRYLGNGIGLALFSGFVLALVVALTSSFSVSIASPQDSPAAILALLVTSLVATLPENTNSYVTFATVMTALVLTTTLTGAFFFGLGQFRLGQLMRYVPYPVVGGFLAGTGWLLLEGGINVMTGARLTPEWAFLLTQPIVVMRWLPGVLLAILLLVVLRRWSHALITPAILGGAIFLFYGTLLASSLTITQARERSWMLGPFPTGGLFQFPDPSMLLDVAWGPLAGQLDKMATILIVSAIALLLNVNGIELAAQRDIDINRELKAAGLGNFLAGLGAGLPGYHLLGASTLSYKLGARSRVTGITAALAVGFALLFGASLLEFFPRPVLGGLLVYLGLSFLIEWLYDAFFKLPRVDYVLILVILAVIAVFGYLPGVGVGLIIAILLFILNYSRLHAVQQELSCVNFRSNVDRPSAEQARIREFGDEVMILRLHEILFFGTAQALLDRIQDRLNAPRTVPLHELVLDFRRVPGMDSSAVAAFLRLEQLARAKNVKLLLTEVAPALQKQLTHGGFLASEPAAHHYLATLDYGVEWCENQILARHPLARVPETFASQMGHLLPDSDALARLMTYLQRIELPAAQTFLRQGEPADAMYFIESGSVSIEVELSGQEKLRLRTTGSNCVIGEIGFYMRGVRTANVVTLEPTVIYRISMAAMHRMEQEDEALAAALHKWIAGIMAERLADNVRTIDALRNS